MDSESLTLHNKTQPQKPPSGDSTARKITAAARRRFCALGFRNVTMDDLAEELGMSKKTLYEHFPSKNALLEAVLLNKLQEADADLDRIGADLSSGVLPVLRRMLACIQMHTDEIKPPFIRDIRRKAPELFNLIESRRSELILRHFGKLINEGRKSGVIRKDIPPRLMIEILLGAVQSVVNPIKIAELGITVQTGMTAILVLIFEGALTGSGRSKK